MGHLYIHPEFRRGLEELAEPKSRIANVNNNATQKPRRFQRGFFNPS
ncbi:hypothetical protein GGD56_007100 [Rhizobium mongolense]|uniref:Uncharacterized protein n=1 Tax=Rhizobium mongolense TaxID=57676 RepID=A0ABR6IZ77_9HYPH|nr:hypothetical protein [Rhizobium mongolense]